MAKKDRSGPKPPVSEDEGSTLGDQVARNRELEDETRRRKEDGTARHGKPPGVHGLTEPPLAHKRGHHSDHRESITSTGVRTHRQVIEKDGASKFPEEDEG